MGVRLINESMKEKTWTMERRVKESNAPLPNPHQTEVLLLLLL